MHRQYSVFLKMNELLIKPLEGERLDPKSKGEDISELQQGENVSEKTREFYVHEHGVHFVEIDLEPESHGQDTQELQQGQKNF